MANVVELGMVLANLGDNLGAMQSKMMANVQRVQEERNTALRLAEANYAKMIEGINTQYNEVLEMLNDQLKAVENLQGLNATVSG